ncbi:hypothetical protein AnigIFM63309_004700 [Aspergillus niger]|nr:hypothetical protein AnigIFM63309_004700 [Aspergillus niger]
MASGVEEPTVDRTFVVINANESDTNFDHRDHPPRNLRGDDVPPIQSTIQSGLCEQAIAARPWTLNGIDMQPCGQLDVGGRKSVLESSGLPPEPDHFNMEMLRLLSLYPADTSRYRRFRHTVHRKGTTIAATVLRQLIRRLAKTNRRSLLNIAETVIRHWVIQKDLTELSLTDNDYAMSVPSGCVVHVDVDSITKSERI